MIKKLKSLLNKAALKEFLESLFFAVIFSGVTIIFFITPNVVRNTSMLPNLHDGQLVLTSSLIARLLAATPFGQSLGFGYYRGEVITFHDKKTNEDLIKRVIGLPGEYIMISRGKVFINDVQLTESYLDSTVYTNQGSFLKEDEKIKIPDNHYFLMGDNRQVSKDSRDAKIGIVSQDDILGKVIVRYWPIPDFTLFRPVAS